MYGEREQFNSLGYRCHVCNCDPVIESRTLIGEKSWRWSKKFSCGFTVESTSTTTGGKVSHSPVEAVAPCSNQGTWDRMRAIRQAIANSLSETLDDCDADEKFMESLKSSIKYAIKR